MLKPDHKICRCCKDELHQSNFYPLKASKDGIHYYCKDCCKMKRTAERVKKRDKKSKISNRQRYRVEQLGLKVDGDITLAKLYHSDKGICQLCHKRVSSKEASIDHRIPVVKGGEHTWENVQLTHLRCNLQKGDRDSLPKTTKKKRKKS